MLVFALTFKKCACNSEYFFLFVCKVFETETTFKNSYFIASTIESYNVLNLKHVGLSGLYFFQF